MTTYDVTVLLPQTLYTVNDASNGIASETFFSGPMPCKLNAGFTMADPAPHRRNTRMLNRTSRF